MPNVPKNTNKAKIQRAARITAEEFERLLAKSSNRGWELLILLAWHCGLRLTEARNVQGEHFDLSQRTLHVPRNKAGDVAATAVVPPELDDYLNRRFPDGIPHGPLIVARQIPTTQGNISKGFASIAKSANVPGNSESGFVTLHDLRRNFGSRWAGKVPAQILQRLMRHSHISVTLDFYADTDNAGISLVWGDSRASL
jgi:integrase